MIQILSSTLQGGFSETNINSTGNKNINKQTNRQKKILKNCQYKQLLTNYLHIEFMTSQIDYQ